MPALPLAGRVAIVTGGGRGIGRAIAERLVLAGASLALLDLDGDLAVTTAAQIEIEMNGRRILGLKADVGNQQEVVSAFDLIRADLGAPDILVNNAGIYTSSSLLAVTAEEWQRTIATNLTGVFFCSQAVAPYLMEKGYGRIINIASISGKVGWPRNQAYCASKAGVIGLSRALAHDLAPYNVTVNVVCPGDTNTDMLRAVDEVVSQAEGWATGTFLRETVKDIPLKRYAEPTDIAALVAFLASPEAAYITGQAINVDGGTVMY